MRLLITGGAGFLGHHLVEHFLKNTKAEIVILDALTYASSGFDRLRDIEIHGERGVRDHVRVKIVGADLRQPITPGVAQEIGPIDYVIHAAAETHVDNSITNPLPFLESNVIGTHHLLTYLRAVPSLKRALLVSTDEVYGPAGEGAPGFGEYDRFRPANPYAAAKAGGEMVAMAYANTYGLPITIVNTMNLIGERQHREKFVPLVISKAVRRQTVYIHADPSRSRSGTRFYLHCRTFADALGFLIDRDAGGAPSPLKVHVCGEREISNLELAAMIAQMVGQALRYELVDFHSSRPGHDLRYAMNDSLIQSLGWIRPMNLEQSLKKTVQWYLDNPRWLGLPTSGGLPVSGDAP